MDNGLIHSLFGKTIHNLTIDDLIGFFNSQQRETDIIEFKSYVDEEWPNTKKVDRDKEKLHDIIRTICGFLNSDGGMLVWGAPKGHHVTESKEKVYSGSLTPVDYKLEPDQFINKIASEISPVPLRVLFQPIKLAGNKFCYVFEVVRSEFAPHQHKGTYYMRLDGSTRPAPHHYVEALIKRISYPKIEAYLTFNQVKHFSSLIAIPLTITIGNLSKLIQEKQVNYRFIIDGADLIESNSNSYTNYKGNSDYSKFAKDILHFAMPYYNNLILITKKLYREEHNISILLMIWGELSPVVMSKYKLKIYPNPAKGYNCEVEIEIEKENSYLIENDSLDLNDTERNRKANQLVAQSFESNFYNLPIYTFLNMNDNDYFK